MERGEREVKLRLVLLQLRQRILKMVAFAGRVNLLVQVRVFIYEFHIYIFLLHIKSYLC